MRKALLALALVAPMLASAESIDFNLTPISGGMFGTARAEVNDGRVTFLSLSTNVHTADYRPANMTFGTGGFSYFTLYDDQDCFAARIIGETMYLFFGGPDTRARFVQISPVPEPETWLMFLLGSAFLAWKRRSYAEHMRNVRDYGGAA